MTTAHASWAAEYDTVFGRSFGHFYDALTRLTVDVITEFAPPPADVVDFGAGTGRLVAPLAAAGYRVTAVDPCAEMLDVLRGKPGLGAIPLRVQRAEDFGEIACCDLALCVFTVTAYWTSLRALDRSVAAIARSLRSGGRLLVDVPTRLVFRSSSAQAQGIERSITMRPLSHDRFRYEETTTVRMDDRDCHIRDAFTIRWWDRSVVIQAAKRHGLTVEADLTGAFAGTGAEYLLLKKS